MRAVVLLPVLIACTSPAPGTASSSPMGDAWPRCYSLRLGGWAPPPGQKLDVTHAPPPVVQLDTLQVRGAIERVGRRLTPDIPALARGGWGMPPSWARLAPDSLELLWSSGYEGVFVTLVEKGDSVSGTARTFTDYGSQALAAVTGRRTACAPAGARSTEP